MTQTQKTSQHIKCFLPPPYKKQQAQFIQNISVRVRVASYAVSNTDNTLVPVTVIPKHASSHRVWSTETPLPASKHLPQTCQLCVSDISDTPLAMCRHTQ